MAGCDLSVQSMLGSCCILQFPTGSHLVATALPLLSLSLLPHGGGGIAGGVSSPVEVVVSGGGCCCRCCD
jgi:hypothetical protein